MNHARPSLRALLFDKDGTLLDYDRTWVPINREVARHAASGDEALANELLALGGHDPVTDRVAAGSTFAGGSLDGIVDMLARHLGRRTPPGLFDSVARLFRDGGGQNSVLLAGAREALVALRGRGFILGLATNDTAAGLEASLARHAILELFAFTVGCDSGHGAKPEAGMVRAFAGAVDVAPRDIAVIGDSIHDLEMGARAGVGLKVAVLSGTSGRDDLGAHADLVLASVADMPGHQAFEQPGK